MSKNVPSRFGEPPTPGDDNARGRYGDAGYNSGIAVFSYIVGGILVWSLIGWGLDNLLETRWLVLAGGLLGAVGGFYLSHKHNLTRSNQPDPSDKQGERPENPGETQSDVR